MGDGDADGLALEMVADGLALEEVADGLALEEVADGVADGDANEDDLEDVGVDGRLSSESVEHSTDKRELSLIPATHSQSTVLLRLRTTLARR